MTEKQVILSKVEYDEMEQKLKDLNAIVDSRTISAIVRPEYAPWGGSKYRIQYILGIDDKEVITELNAEIDSLKKTIADYSDRAWDQSRIISALEDKIKVLEQKKPWYKKMFSKN